MSDDLKFTRHTYNEKLPKITYKISDDTIDNSHYNALKNKFTEIFSSKLSDSNFQTILEAEKDIKSIIGKLSYVDYRYNYKFFEMLQKYIISHSTRYDSKKFFNLDPENLTSIINNLTKNENDDYYVDGSGQLAVYISDSKTGIDRYLFAQAYLGIFFINELKKYFPNFLYTYLFLSCDSVYKDSENCYTMCAHEKEYKNYPNVTEREKNYEPISVLIRENVEYEETFQSFMENLKENKLNETNREKLIYFFMQFSSIINFCSFYFDYYGYNHKYSYPGPFFFNPDWKNIFIKSVDQKSTEYVYPYYINNVEKNGKTISPFKHVYSPYLFYFKSPDCMTIRKQTTYEKTFSDYTISYGCKNGIPENVSIFIEEIANYSGIDYQEINNLYNKSIDYALQLQLPSEKYDFAAEKMINKGFQEEQWVNKSRYYCHDDCELNKFFGDKYECDYDCQSIIISNLLTEVIDMHQNENNNNPKKQLELIVNFNNFLQIRSPQNYNLLDIILTSYELSKFPKNLGREFSFEKESLIETKNLCLDRVLNKIQSLEIQTLMNATLVVYKMFMIVFPYIYKKYKELGSDNDVDLIENFFKNSVDQGIISFIDKFMPTEVVKDIENFIQKQEIYFMKLVVFNIMNFTESVYSNALSFINPGKDINIISKILNYYNSGTILYEHDYDYKSKYGGNFGFIVRTKGLKEYPNIFSFIRKTKFNDEKFKNTFKNFDPYAIPKDEYFNSYAQTFFSQEFNYPTEELDRLIILSLYNNACEASSQPNNGEEGYAATLKDLYNILDDGKSIASMVTDQHLTEFRDECLRFMIRNNGRMTQIPIPNGDYITQYEQPEETGQEFNQEPVQEEPSIQFVPPQVLDQRQINKEILDEIYELYKNDLSIIKDETVQVDKEKESLNNKKYNTVEQINEVKDVLEADYVRTVILKIQIMKAIKERLYPNNDMKKYNDAISFLNKNKILPAKFSKKYEDNLNASIFKIVFENDNIESFRIVDQFILKIINTMKSVRKYVIQKEKVQEPPVQQTRQQTRVQEPPVQQTRAQQTRVQEPPVQQTRVQEPPVQQTRVQEPLVQQTRVQQEATKKLLENVNTNNYIENANKLGIFIPGGVEDKYQYVVNEINNMTPVLSRTVNKPPSYDNPEDYKYYTSTELLWYLPVTNIINLSKISLDSNSIRDLIRQIIFITKNTPEQPRYQEYIEMIINNFSEDNFENFSKTINEIYDFINQQELNLNQKSITIYALLGFVFNKICSKEVEINTNFRKYFNLLAIFGTVNYTDTMGDTPLIKCCKNNKNIYIEFFKRRVNIESSDIYKRTALYYAFQKLNVPVINSTFDVLRNSKILRKPDLEDKYFYFSILDNIKEENVSSFFQELSRNRELVQLINDIELKAVNPLRTYIIGTNLSKELKTAILIEFNKL